MILWEEKLHAYAWARNGKQCCISAALQTRGAPAASLLQGTLNHKKLYPYTSQQTVPLFLLVCADKQYAK